MARKNIQSKSKRCTECDEKKILKEFPVKESGSLGRGAKCKECIADFKKDGRPVRLNEMGYKQREWYAKKHGIAMTPSDLL